MDDGVCIFQLYSREEQAELSKRLLDEIGNGFEFNNNALQGEKFPVMGAFGGIATISSTHGITGREIRSDSYNKSVELLKTIYQGKYLSLFYDRAVWRKDASNKKADKNKWHRDQTVGNGIGIQGWVNLTDKDQHFLCLLGSHTFSYEKTGFVLKEAPLEEDQTVLTIPPGHQILFVGSLLHGIYNKYESNYLRQHVGFFISDENINPFPDIVDRLNEFRSLPLPSGQFSPMYSKMHLINHFDMLVDFSKNMNPLYLESRQGTQMRRGDNPKKTYTAEVVRRFINEPVPQHIQKLTPYTQQEIDQYQPKLL
mgnify:CR=1 FL=1